VKITLLTDNPKSWIIPFVSEFKDFLEEKSYDVVHVFDSSDVTPSDVLFVLSCEKLVPPAVLSLNCNNIVVHPSALPKHRGWSPLTWQVLEGRDIIPVSLFEAKEGVDSGPIYLQENINLNGSELNNEMKNKQGQITLKLLKEYLKNRPTLVATEQEGEATFCDKLKPKDSEIDINAPIKSQFNKLRVVDNERYPAFFYNKGRKYILKIYKENE